MEEGVPIESGLITRRIEAAQKAVEGQNFEARKHVLEYDDVMNKQRQAVYGLRRQLLEGLDQKELILEDYVRDILGGLLDKYCGKEMHPEDWDIKNLKAQVFTRFGVDIEAEGVDAEKLNRQELGDAIFEKLKQRYDAKEQLIGAGSDAASRAHHDAERARPAVEGPPAEHGPSARRHRIARVWPARSAGGVQARVVRHVRSHDGALRRRDGALPLPVAGDRAQRRGDAYSSDGPVDGGNGDASAASGKRGTAAPAAAGRPPWTTWKKPSSGASGVSWNRRAWQAEGQEPVQQVVRGDKVGRNDPCPCGSGKKYKKCHGA